MADSRQFIDEFLIDLPNHGRKWKNFAVNPFAKAYVAARKAYDDMAKAQADADSETPLGLKLALLALSLCGGGAMTAAFGTTALKTIASNAAVAVICRRNMDKAFTAANFIATNKTASFVAGKLWDEIENGATGFLGNKFKPTDLAQNPAAFPSVNKFVQDTWEMYLALDTFIGEAHSKIHDLARAIRESTKLGEAEKIDKVTKLSGSSFCHPPEESVDKGLRMADEIELSFYLNLVLESDVLLSNYERDWEDTGLGRRMHRAKTWSPTKRAPIAEMPSSKNYPTDSQGERSSPGYQTVSYNKVGGKIVDQMNDLHKKRFNDTLVDHGIDRLVLLNAERSLDNLASSNVKRLIQDAGKIAAAP